MITLPTGLNAFMKGQKLDGLKPFALLYRNKWDSVNNKYALEQTPIDISALIAKPNTLSMTLDVNEVAQYNANNVTLTLSDTKNYFVEGTPNSYFPEGYQIYGSRIVLYYGTDGVNRTPLFTGVIKDLPTHKPENYQVDVKLVSPLEMLKDIEAKDFSDKVTGETLTYKSTDSDGHRIYWTTGTGVGGFDAVYANGTKLFEGVDYETDQLNALGLPAIVTIINADYYASTITADYYTWKTGLTVEQIVAGLVGVAGYDSGTEDIRNVVWNTDVQGEGAVSGTADFTIGYAPNGNSYTYRGSSYFWNSFSSGTTALRYNKFPNNFKINFKLYPPWWVSSSNYFYQIGQFSNGNLLNGFSIARFYSGGDKVRVSKVTNGNYSTVGELNFAFEYNLPVEITKQGTSITFSFPAGSCSSTVDFDINSTTYNEKINNQTTRTVPIVVGYVLTDTSNGAMLSYDGVMFSPATISTPGGAVWKNFTATLSNQSSVYALQYRTSEDAVSYDSWQGASIGVNLGVSARYIQFALQITTPAVNTNILNALIVYLGSSSLILRLVNLSGLTVLEALQDFALISGYEFGVDRQGVFFFRPRVSSTTPTYILDHEEIVKVDTVKKNLSDFFTKLTLTFAQVPLEFYANTGERPTLVDKYGIINKEIDKPDIVNYDNPELAQAIGPQLLEVYSALPNIIQVTGKLNLSLELGDIVSLRRNMNLITPEGYTDYSKYTDLNTYYRACKITAMNYNFSKRQITYTLRDVSNKNTEPQYEFNEYIYEYQVQFGVKE